jgi:asparagine N-glycosylation enzyme membrane subunit Stt3
MEEKTSRAQMIKLIILVVVIMAGISFRYFYNTGTRLDQPIRGDGWQYLMYSKNLLEHSTFSRERDTNSPSPDSYWAPGYPIFLAVVTKTSELLDTEFYTTFMHSQLILGGLTILFTYLLANSFLPRFWPILPALLVAFSPHLVSIGSNLLSETLTGFLLVAALYFCVLGIKSANSAKVCVAGCFFCSQLLDQPSYTTHRPINRNSNEF